MNFAIANRVATRLLNHQGLIDRLREQLNGTTVLVTDSEETTKKLLDKISPLVAADSIIYIIGGDGTVRTVLNWALRLPKERQPILVPLGGGHVCYMAAFVGLNPHNPVHNLALILASPERFESFEWRPVELINHAQGERLFCAVFGNGVLYDFIHWMEGGDSSHGRNRKKTNLAVMAMVISSAIKAVVFGGQSVGPLANTWGEVEFDGFRIPSRKYVALIASTVPRLSLGLRPFLGERRSGQMWSAAYWGTFRRLASFALFIFFAWIPPWGRKAIYNQPSKSIMIRTSDPRYMVDGCCKQVPADVLLVNNQCAFELKEGPPIRLLALKR